jgi:integrase
MAIEKRGEFSFRVSIRRKGYPNVSETFNTLVDAKKYQRQILVEMDQGVFVKRDESSKKTLYEVLTKYEVDVSQKKKSWESEKYKIRYFQNHKLAKHTMANLKASDFAELRDELSKSGKANATVNKHLALLSHVFSVCQKDWGFEINNPILKIRKLKENNARSRRLENDEYEYLIKAANASNLIELTALIQLGIETAMRQGELLLLEWKFINIKKRVIILPKHITKNGTERHVPLSTEAAKVIESIPRQLISQKIFHGVLRRNLSEQFKIACLKGRELYKQDHGKVDDGFLINLKFHDQRHEAASRLFESGKFDTMEVSAITGHKTLQMLKRYTHLKAEDLARKLA